MTAYPTIICDQQKKISSFSRYISQKLCKYRRELRVEHCLPSIKPGIRPQNPALLKVPLKIAHPEFHSNKIYLVTCSRCEHRSSGSQLGWSLVDWIHHHSSHHVDLDIPCVTVSTQTTWSNRRCKRHQYERIGKR